MIRLRAPAKLNLALRVGALAADGFHPVATVLQTVSLSDLLYARLLVGTAEGMLRLQVSGAELPGDNTVSRAVAAMAEVAVARGIEPLPLSVKLVKRIPTGAGLGGGSSDAVAAMAVCARLWGLDPHALEEDGVLQEIAAGIGSDVPFFLHGGTALGGGRGDLVEPLEPLAPTWFVAAAPRLQVPTPAAYAAFDRVAPEAMVEPKLPPYRARLDGSWMGNDLAAAVADRWPEVEVVRRRLEDAGGRFAHMTGSGAASFAAFADRRAATRAARALRRGGDWATACVTVDAARQRRSLFV